MLRNKYLGFVEFSVQSCLGKGLALLQVLDIKGVCLPHCHLIFTADRVVRGRGSTTRGMHDNRKGTSADRNLPITAGGGTWTLSRFQGPLQTILFR